MVRALGAIVDTDAQLIGRTGMCIGIAAGEAGFQVVIQNCSGGPECLRCLPAECLASLPMDMTQTLHPLDSFALPHETLEALSDQVLDMSRRPVLDEASSHEASSEASGEDRSITLSSDSNEEVRPLKNNT